jgi:hypothetical protein
MRPSPLKAVVTVGRVGGERAIRGITYFGEEP